jgi:hypothetical protein
MPSLRATQHAAHFPHNLPLEFSRYVAAFGSKRDSEPSAGQRREFRNAAEAPASWRCSNGPVLPAALSLQQESSCR